MFTVVRTRTPTREEARAAAAAGACLHAGTLPKPCVCCSGTASGGRVEQGQAYVSFRNADDAEGKKVLRNPTRVRHFLQPNRVLEENDEPELDRGRAAGGKSGVGRDSQ